MNTDVAKVDRADWHSGKARNLATQQPFMAEFAEEEELVEIAKTEL